MYAPTSTFRDARREPVWTGDDHPDLTMASFLSRHSAHRLLIPYHIPFHSFIPLTLELLLPVPRISKVFDNQQNKMPTGEPTKRSGNSSQIGR